MKKPMNPIMLFTAFCCGAFAAQAAGGLTDSADAQHISFPDARLAVSGLAWYEEDKPALRRLPLRLKDSFRAPVWSLGQQPSGGRIRFKTDSGRVAIRAQNPDSSGMHHMTTIGQSGFDIYYWGNPSPEVFKATLPKFVETLRKKYPRIRTGRWGAL